MNLRNTDRNGIDIPVMVFKNERDGKKTYQIGLNKKGADGNYVNGYILAQFNKDVELDNKTKIVLVEASLDFFVSDNRTVPFIRVWDFAIPGAAKQESKDDFITIDTDDLPF